MPVKGCLFFLVLSVSLVGSGLYAASLFDQGEDALRANDPAKAKPLLQAALNENPQNDKIYLDLGIAEIQLGAYNDAIAVMKQGLAFSQQYADRLAFNIANVYFMQGQNTLAEGMYTQALQKNPNFAEAYLNRANARMRLQSFDDAASDYSVYLTLAPTSPQRDAIQKLLDLLSAAKAQAQAEQAAAEAKKKEEAARQQALLDQVMQQLQSASTNTTNLHADTAPLQDSKVNLGLDD